MWPLRSLAITTDLALTAFDGEVIDRGRYVVVRTPSNPGYHWGNYLVYPEPPDASSHRIWLDDHARELPGVHATVLAWDRPDGALGDVAAFLGTGFVIDEGAVLTVTLADLTVPPRRDPAIAIARIDGDARWQDAARVLTSAFAPGRSGTLQDLGTFVARQLARYRAMQEHGLGCRYGAYVGGELAGVLGLVRLAGSRLGRFQLVGTDPRFARRGVCSTLLHDVARRALEDSVETLVITADAEYHAASVYESVGFRPTERLRALIRKPPPG